MGGVSPQRVSPCFWPNNPKLIHITASVPALEFNLNKKYPEMSIFLTWEEVLFY